MTEEHEHQADAIEQDIASEAPELVNEEAAGVRDEATPEETVAESPEETSEADEIAEEDDDIDEEDDIDDDDDEEEDDDEEDEDDDEEDEDDDEEDEDEEDDDEDDTEEDDEIEGEVEVEVEIEDSAEEAVEDGPDAEDESKPRPPVKLERLQKILAQAGVASRRRAEELMTQGRVQVNGKIVTELGSKADAGRDHIRVDGKLLHGAERLRYFILNKPKGYVTTVKDPEGRNTVMEFFAKMPERLYPVGRLDYQSEGLLLVTNDGELANRLTKASSGVEKTYLVKVAGQPTEAELDILRGGVTIDRAKVGEGRVRTAPARVRQVRQGDNPWYEVVLIEGRNRELRKMFEEVGHFVEKIRRVGYGPLVLDLEPGNLRELEPQELVSLRLAAEGKLRTPKAKEMRRRNSMDAQLPTLAPRPTRLRPSKPFEKGANAGRTGDSRPKRSFDADRTGGAERPPFRPAAGRTGAGPARFGTGRPADRTGARPAWNNTERPSGPPSTRSSERFPTRPPARSDSRPQARSDSRPDPRPEWKRDDRPARPAGRPAWKKDSGEGRSFGAKPAWNNKPSSGDRPFKRPATPRPEAPDTTENFTAPKPSRLQIDPVEPGTYSERPSFKRPQSDRPRSDRPRTDRPQFDRPRTERPAFNRPPSNRPRPERAGSDRPQFDRPRPDRGGNDRPQFDRPRSEGSRFERSGPGRTGGGRPGGGRPSSGRPSSGRPSSGRPSSGPGRTGVGGYSSVRPQGSSRAGTTSTGIPRAGGPRPNNKHGKSTDGSYGAGSRSGPGAGARPGGNTGWKPKPSFGGSGRPSSGGSSRPQSGGYKGGSSNRSGPRTGGSRPGGAPGGRKRD